MSGAATTSAGFTLVTPTCERDLERFRLLRRSIAESGTTAPHVAIVDTEDVALFTGSRDRGVTIVATADLLPPDLEKRRRASRWRRRIYHRVSLARSRMAQPIDGWFIQQVCKIMAATAMEPGIAVCIDSDAYVLRALQPSLFESNGRIRFLSVPSPTPRTARYAVNAARFLGVHADAQLSPWEYINCMVPWSPSVVQRMCRHVEEVHAERWQDRFLRTNATEYHSYGVFVNDVEGPIDVDPRSDHPTVQYYDGGFLRRSQVDLAQEWQRNDAYVTMVHSRLDLPIVDTAAHLSSAARVFRRMAV